MSFYIFFLFERIPIAEMLKKNILMYYFGYCTFWAMF